MVSKAIMTLCKFCDGTSLVKRTLFNEDGSPNGSEDVPCPKCAGTGYATWGSLDIGSIETDLDWVKKKIKKIMNKLEVDDE